VNLHQQLVVSLLQDQPAESDVARLNALADSGWRELVSVADELGLAPLIVRRTESHRLQVSSAIHEELLERLRSNTARNLRILAQFGILASALKREGIAFMPLKGVYLCSNVYDNPGARSIWDIDLIVAPAEMQRALEVIESTGYRPSRRYDLELEIKSHQHVPAYVKAGAVPLEVHWTLLEPRFQNGLGWRDLWDRSVSAQVGEVTAQVLSPVDLVIYLCAHAAYHHVYAASLRSLYDIKLVIDRFSAELDWAFLERRARACRLMNSVYLSLRLTSDLLGCRLAESELQALRPQEFSPALESAAYARMFDQLATSPVVNAVWARRGLRRRIKGLWDRIALSPRDLARTYRVPLNSRRLRFYYLIRSKDMLAKHAGELLRLLLGRPQARNLARLDAQLLAYLGWWE
jgi:hypothetical protein